VLTEDEKAEKLTEEVVKEQKAKVIINGVKEILDRYKMELFYSLSQSKWMQVKKRENIYMQIKAVNELEVRLIRDIQTGKMARDQLSQMQKVAQKAKNVVGLT
jgi:phosphopantetheine adenylyltransferase